MSRSAWLDSIEHKAYRRLRQLRERGLWDGVPPVPIDHVLEHLLDLSISWEDVVEEPDEEILACLRPETREVVMNERYRERFERIGGLEEFSKAHEAGHADVFALCADPEQIPLLPTSGYRPKHRSATRGVVAVLTVRLKELSPEMRSEVLRELKNHERTQQARGEDSPLERRAVEHYGAVLLMPEDIVRACAKGVDLSQWSEIVALATKFHVSRTAMRIRLEELRLIYPVGVQSRNPAGVGQEDLFS
jgi:hypothetical protein